ncbi:MAG TPA: serine hydrolase [Flavobacteriales bacterium]
MKRRSLLPLLLLAIPFRGLPVKGQQPVDPAMAAALQQVLDSCRIATVVPGISTTFLFPDGRYWNGVSGVAHIGTNAPMDTSYVFQAASVTKHFTTTIVMQLVEEGELALDDTIGSYITTPADIPGSTRIRHLLNHRSGLADYLQAPGAANNWFLHPDSVWPPDQILELYSDEPLFAPNAAFSYSNTNFMLLGMIVEAVTGTSFAQELQERILDPLGLEEAYFPPDLPITGNLVPGWTSFTQPNVYDTDVTPVLQDCFSSFGWSAGALVARPWELAHGVRAMQDGTLLEAGSLTAMRTCTNVNFTDGCNGYGLGTMRYTYAGRTYYGHGGDISGFTQMAVHGIHDSISFAISINRNNAPRGPIAAALLAAAHRALSVGIAHRDAPHLLSVHPNPTTGLVHLDGPALPSGAIIDVRDALGRPVQRIRPVGVAARSVDLSALPPGTYQLSVLTTEGPWWGRVVRE